MTLLRGMRVADLVEISVKFLFPSVVTNGHTKHFMTPRENALLAGIHPFRKWLPNINSFVSIKLA